MCLPVVERAAHAAAAAVQHVGVDHGGAHLGVAEELLDGPDVVLERYPATARPARNASGCVGEVIGA
jgi:hypothetical protein